MKQILQIIAPVGRWSVELKDKEGGLFEQPVIFFGLIKYENGENAVEALVMGEDEIHLPEEDGREVIKLNCLSQL